MRRILIAVAGAALLAGVAAAQGPHGPGMTEHLFQADANNDGVVTRAEFDAGRDARFASMDADHDGALDRGEHRRGHREMMGGHHGGRQGMMAGADANGDGSISRDEFLAHPLQMFARLDANSDGSISAEEQAQMRALHEQRREDRRERRAERPNPDTNGDRQISRDEFAAMGTTMFERMDADHDGRLTRQEAEAAHEAFRAEHGRRGGR